MLDMIFAVDDPIDWHNENLKTNWNHYSAVRHLGSRSIGHIQSLSAGVYYNTLVKIDKQVIKQVILISSISHKNLSSTHTRIIIWSIMTFYTYSAPHQKTKFS